MIDTATQKPIKPKPIERREPDAAETAALFKAASAKPGEGPNFDDLALEIISPPTRPLTELGNAEFLVDRYGGVIHYSHPTKTWYVWDGKRWTEDRAAMVAELAQDTTRALLLYAGDNLTRELREEAAKWALKSESAQRIRAMIELARSIPGIPIVPDEFDRDPWLLNCPNGTLDLRDGRLRPHCQEDLITTLCPTPFDPTARAPRWEQFLAEITNGDADLARFVLRYFGYCLTGTTREQIFPIFWGPGANGKSVLLDAIKAVLGSDYAVDAAPDLFTLSKSKQHPTELADLRGRRLVVASETEEDSALRLQLVKRLTGDARIKARFMYGDFFEFDRTHKSVLITNSKPLISEDTEAVWRRIRLVPFTATIPPERRDPRLLERLRAEAPGILASLVRGCLDWQRDGLGSARVVEAASAQYRAGTTRDERGSILRFVEGHCERDDEAFTLSEDLRESFEAAGFPTLTAKDFGLALKALGFQPDRRRDGRGFRGLRLRSGTEGADSPQEWGSPCPL